MNLYIIGALLLVYPVFGFGIYYFSNRLSKTKNVSKTVFLPTLISFFLGIVFMVYAIIFGQ